MTSTASEIIYNKLTQVFRDVFEESKLEATPGMTAADVENWDSMGHVRMILTVESTFGISFSTSELAEFANVGELADMIGVKLAG